MPPAPVPTQMPIELRSSSASSRNPASSRARAVASSESWENGAVCFCVRFGNRSAKRAENSSGISPPIRVGQPVVSKRRTRPIPETPAHSFFQFSAVPTPRHVIKPIPVT